MTSQSGLVGSVFRAFARDSFQEWPAWRRLQRILSSNGGSYGLVGPRGAGKTWLMLRAVEEARAGGGVGLWFPSPSEYDPMAFLSSLSDSFAAEVERRFRSRGSLSLVYAARSPLFAVALAGILFPVGIWGADNIPGVTVARDSALRAVIAAPLAIGLSLTVVGVLGFVTRLFPRGRLVADARTLQERIRYSTTLSEGTQTGASAGQSMLSVTRSKSRELVERPTTISSLVHDFRDLGRHTGLAVGSARVVIAIDELDKMAEPDKVRALLRDIKGIFDIEGVHFLVSVSHEAARALKLGGLGERNEFNSSFYTVLELPPLWPAQCVELLETRWRLAGRDRPLERRAAGALGVLAGGNPRESIRLADLADESPGSSPLAVVLRAELLEFRRQALSLDSGAVRTDEAKARLYRDVSALTGTHALAVGACQRYWNPSWHADESVVEEWRRLLIRLEVAARLSARSHELDDADLERLSAVVAEASLSATVAQLMLDEAMSDGGDGPSMAGASETGDSRPSR